MSIYPSELKAFADALPVPLYAVGGCVRDALLGRISHDVDLCSAMRPEQLAAFAEAAGVPCSLVNARLGTVLLQIGGTKYEHTTFRTESYPPGGMHTPQTVAFTDSLTADAFRRDFSINALYQNVSTGELVDPTGGLHDLEHRVLRTTTPDPAVILRDDGLRILRLVRFAVSTGFMIDPATWEAAKAHEALLDSIAWERKRQELDRLLVFDDVLRALTHLQELGALFRLFPELKDADGLAQRPDYHKYDVLTHMLHTCAAMPPAVELRLMGLLHDVGKPKSLFEYGNYHRHAYIGERMSEAILKRLTYPNATVKRVSLAVGRHMFDLDGHAKESTLRQRFVEWGRQGTEDAIALREADIRGSGYQTAYVAARWRRVYQAMLNENVPWTTSELALSGREIIDALGMAPSPAVAKLQGQLLLHCVCHPKDNTKARLLKRLSDFGAPTAENA